MESSGKDLYPTITLSATQTIQVSFGHATLGAAHFAVMNNSTGKEVNGKAFNIPASAGTTLYVSISLDAGAYYFRVTPENSTKTSGLFKVTY